MTASRIDSKVPPAFLAAGSSSYREIAFNCVDAPPSERPRLIVLVPDSRIDEEDLIERLAELATPSVGEIQFIGLGWSEPGSRMALRLESLAFKAQRLPVVISSRMIEARSWLKAIQGVARPGDQIVCHTEQQAGRLAEEIEATMPFPVHRLTGLHPTLLSRILLVLGRMAFEIFPLVVVAGFFWLQINLDGQTKGTVNTIVMILTVLVELGLIFVWSLFIK